LIRHIIHKEISGNLLSLRFILSLLLIIPLFAVSGFIFVSQFRHELDDYRNETNKNASAFRECARSLGDLAFYKQSIWKEPEILAFCADGFEQSLPNLFKINVFEIEHPEVKSRTSLLLGHFINIDWVFIISIVLSFTALLLTYDSFCGEKQSGTLSLMLACSISRYKVLLGKYLGAMFTLGIPLLTGLLLHLIILTCSSVVTIGSGKWPRILAVIVLSILYLSIFVLLGMFVSSRTAHPANSMMILLLLWAGFVIITPGLGRIFSGVAGKMLSGPELARKIRKAEEQIWDNREKYAIDASIVDDHGRYVNPKATARFFNAITESRNRFFESYMNQIMAQANTGRRFIRISPAVIYQSASETIVGTGVSRFWDIYQQLRRYQKTLKEFVLGLDQLDNESHHALFERQGDGRQYISQKPVDFGNVPCFQERDLALGQSLKSAIWDIGLLVLFNLAFFSAAFVSFLQYDVR
jgi:ABC-type transport system involved in multi-copper enzyme maturation permease subunit